MINITSIGNQWGGGIKRCIAVILVSIFSLSSAVPLPFAHAQATLNLPAVGTMVGLSTQLRPPTMMGIKVYPQNPFRFDFIINKGDDFIEDAALKVESDKLIKYFLAALTVPEEDLWVNLSPYERDRIIPERFAVTAMGRDLLAQDYLLKQLSASLLYPENELGEAFWDRIYQKAYEQYGQSDVPVNTFNKVWIVPETALVYENVDSAFIVKSRLKVMLEHDYLAKEAQKSRSDNVESVAEDPALSDQIIRDLILPEIEKEINDGKNFAQLRQIYHSMILATWFKRNLKESLLGQKYVDQNKIQGIDLDDERIKEKIYQQYLDSFKQGVYDFVREEYDPREDVMLARKYFSGGFAFKDRAYQKTLDQFMSTEAIAEHGGEENFITAESFLKDPQKSSSAEQWKAANVLEQSRFSNQPLSGDRDHFMKSSLKYQFGASFQSQEGWVLPESFARDFMSFDAEDRVLQIGGDDVDTLLDGDKTDKLFMWNNIVFRVYETHQSSISIDDGKDNDLYIGQPMLAIIQNFRNNSLNKKGPRVVAEGLLPSTSGRYRFIAVEGIDGKSLEEMEELGEVDLERIFQLLKQMILDGTEIIDFGIGQIMLGRRFSRPHEPIQAWLIDPELDGSNTISIVQKIESGGATIKKERIFTFLRLKKRTKIPTHNIRNLVNHYISSIHESIPSWLKIDPRKVLLSNLESFRDNFMNHDHDTFGDWLSDANVSYTHSEMASGQAQLDWLDQLDQHPHIAQSPLARRAIFGLMLSTFYYNWREVLANKMQGSPDIYYQKYGHYFWPSALTESGRYRIIERLYDFWQDHQLDNVHGSFYYWLHLFAMNNVIENESRPLLAKEYDYLANVKMIERLVDAKGDLNPYRLLGLSNHVRVASGYHARETFESLDGQEVRGYVDLEVLKHRLVKFIPKYIKAYMDHEPAILTDRIFSNEFVARYAIATALDELLFLDQQELRQDMLAQLYQEVGPENLIRLWQRIADTNFKKYDVQHPAASIFQNKYITGNFLNQIYQSNNAIQRNRLQSKENIVADPLLHFLLPKIASLDSLPVRRPGFLQPREITLEDRINIFNQTLQNDIQRFKSSSIHFVNYVQFSESFNSMERDLAIALGKLTAAVNAFIPRYSREFIEEIFRHIFSVMSTKIESDVHFVYMFVNILKENLSNSDQMETNNIPSLENIIYYLENEEASVPKDSLSNDLINSLAKIYEVITRNKNAFNKEDGPSLLLDYIQHFRGFDGMKVTFYNYPTVSYQQFQNRFSDDFMRKGKDQDIFGEWLSNADVSYTDEEMASGQAQLDWLNQLNQHPHIAQSPLARKAIFGLILSLFYKEWIYATDRGMYGESEKYYGNYREYFRFDLLNDEARKQVLLRLHELWKKYQMDNLHGSFHYWVLVFAMDNVFVGESREFLVEEYDYLHNVVLLENIFDEIGEINPYGVLLNSAHLRTSSSDHAEEVFERINSSKVRKGYADLEALRVRIPKLIKQYVDQYGDALDGWAYKDVNDQVISEEFLIAYSIASAMDPYIYFDRLEIRNEILQDVLKLVNPADLIKVWKRLLRISLGKTQHPVLLRVSHNESTNRYFKDFFETTYPIRKNLLNIIPREAHQDPASLFILPLTSEKIFAIFETRIQGSLSPVIRLAEERMRIFLRILDQDMRHFQLLEDIDGQKFENLAHKYFPVSEKTQHSTNFSIFEKEFAQALGELVDLINDHSSMPFSFNMGSLFTKGFRDALSDVDFDERFLDYFVGKFVMALSYGSSARTDIEAKLKEIFLIMIKAKTLLSEEDAKLALFEYIRHFKSFSQDGIEFYDYPIEDYKEFQASFSSPDAFMSHGRSDSAEISVGLATPKGGIDFDPTDMTIKTQGNKVQFQVPDDFMDLDTININGLTPVIFNWIPAPNIPLILGFAEDPKLKLTKNNMLSKKSHGRNH